MAARRVRASSGVTPRAEGGGAGGSSSHSGRRFHTRSGSSDAIASGRPRAASTASVQPQPPFPMRAASSASGLATGAPRNCTSRDSSVAAMSGRAAAAFSRPGPGGSMSSARARPRGVGAAERAGSTKAKSSSRSSAGIGPMSSRRSVAGACTSSGTWPCSSRPAAAAGSDSISPSAVRIAARAAPATTAGATTIGESDEEAGSGIVRL